MTLPWSKLPRSLAGDPRWLLLSPEGVCAYDAARLLADDDGALWCVGDRDAAGTLADVIARRRPGDVAWSRRAVEECIKAGLLDAEGDVLRVVDWIGDGPQEPRPRRAPAEPQATPAVPEKPAPERRGANSTERADRLRFRRRLGRYAGIPEGVSYEDREAHATVGNGRRNGRNVAGNGSATDATVDATVGNGRKPLRNGSRAGSETSEKEGEEREPEPETERARCVAATDATATATVDATVGNGRNGNGSVASLPLPLPDLSLDSLTDVDVLLDRMRQESCGRLALAVAAPQVARGFGLLVQSLVQRGRTTVPKVVAAAKHATHEGWITRKARALTLDRLMAEDGRVLVELLTAAETCPDCGGTPLATVGSATRAAVDRAADEDDADDWVREAEREARRLNPNPAARLETH